ncbi:mediator of RNA polymerase II transcription subunit 16 [Medicago truncatula]|uniref:Mediator of RNA polymerase II transcription subunit 16 n=1 Tax=Medicago truncatula TaxID=3880 RepID=G7IDN9_MEDTR|nr:mediator of RNA polymerase II transcription subunit 16 [Medicago truncatula]
MLMPPSKKATRPKWFCTSKGLLDCGPSGIISGDAIITHNGTLYVAAAQAFNPATVIVWEVSHGHGTGLEFAPKTSITTSTPLSPPNWSAALTTKCCGVVGVAFDPTCGCSVIVFVVVEGKYMSPHDPYEGPSIIGWRESKVDISIPATHDKSKRIHFNHFDLPIDLGTLARVVYSAQDGEIVVAFLHGGIHIFSCLTFTPLANYQINVGSSIVVPTFSTTCCCSASVWHGTNKGEAMLKIIRVLPPAFPIGQEKANSSTWERAIAER